MSEIDDFLKGPDKAPAGSIDEFLGSSKPAAPGFIPTVKRTAGQMLTGAATTLEDVTGANRVTQGLRSIGQGIIERNPAGIQSIGDIAESPWLAVKEAVGNMVPQIGTGIAGRAAGAQLGARLGGQAAGGRGALVGGIAGGLAPIWVQEYGGIRDEQKEGKQESIPRAVAAATGATALEMLGPEGRIAAKGVNAISRTGKQIAKQAGRDALVEGATEGAQTVVEQLGAFKDPREAKNLEETALFAALGGIGGGVVGGAHAGLGAALAPQQKTPAAGEAAATDTETPAQQPVVTPATADQVRAQKLPDTGPLSAGVNAGIEHKAQIIESATRQPATLRDMGDGRFELPAPPMEVSEISLADAAQLAARPADLLEDVPVGQAEELPVEVADTSGLEIQPEPRAPRQRSEDAADILSKDIDRDGRIAVAKYLSQMRRTNTPAARAFMQDFEAGRITRADVLRIVRPPADRSTQPPDERLAAAAAQAPAKAPEGLLLTYDGFPYGTRAAAVQRASREKLDAGSVIEVVGGYAVRPKETPNEPVGNVAVPAPRAAGSADAGSDQSGRGVGAVRPGVDATGRVDSGPAAPDTGAVANAVPADAGVADDSLSAPLAQRVERMREANTAAAQPVQGAEEAAAAQWGAMSERQRIATVAKAGQVVLPAQTWDSIPKQARAAIAAVMPAQTTAPAGMTQIPGMPNEWAASIEQGPNKVHQFNLRRFGGGVTGNPVKWRLTRSTRFPGTGITGAPTVEVGTFDSESEALAALAAEKARIAPPEQAPAAAPPESAAQPSQGARDGQEQRLQGRREEEVAGPPQLAGMADEERKAGGDPAVWSGRSAMQAGFARKAPSELSPDAAARWLAGWDAAKAETSETRPAAPVAESQAPAPSEPGDGEVATTQDSGAPSSPTPRELARLRKLLASLTELRACVAA